ncbi:hypothetical protein [Parapedobacter sp.]
MKNQLNILKLSDELESIVGPELYALKGGFHGGGSDGPMQATGILEDYSYYGDNLVLEKYLFTGADGQTTVVHKAVGVRDQFGQIIRDPITQEFIPPSDLNAISNCLGYALMDGEYIVLDINEDIIEEKFGYVRCDKSQASLVVIYNGSEVSHAGAYNPSTDTYDAKGGGSQYYIRTGMTLAEFYQPYNDDIDPNNNENYQPQNPNDIVYYKKVYY